MNPDVDAYLERSKKWPTTTAALRPVLLSTGLSEAIKWHKPCHSDAGKNIVIIQEMNDFLALMFFKGALRSDSEEILQGQGPKKQTSRIFSGNSLRDR